MKGDRMEGDRMEGGRMEGDGNDDSEKLDAGRRRMTRAFKLCVFVLIAMNLVVIVSAFAQTPAARFLDSSRVPRYQAPEQVEFRSESIISEGVRLNAEVFSPKDSADKPLPTIIQAHGWGGTAAGFRWDSVELAKAGFRVISFDYRGWGLSDGRLVLAASPSPGSSAGRRLTAQVEELREYVDPIEQVTDWFNVIHWAMGDERFDKQRIGLRGSSYSGGHVVYVAARDPRVKAIVSQVGGFGSGWVVASDAMRRTTYDEATRRSRAELGYPEPRSRAVGNLVGAPIREKLALYAPLEEAPKLTSCAALFIVAEREELFSNSDNAGRAFELMPGTRKKYVSIPEIAHYGIYREARAEAIRLAIEWFDQNLKSPSQ